MPDDSPREFREQLSHRLPHPSVAIPAPPFGRREFLGALGTAALGLTSNRLTPGHLTAPSPGIQLYTLRTLLAADLDGTLAALAAIGYREVELAGTYGHDATDFRRALDRHRLSAPAGHVGVEALTETLEQTIADARVLGHRYVVLPWVPEEWRGADGYRRLADLLNHAGERCRQASIRVAYHNHDFDFAPLGDAAGECGYDVLLARTDPRLVVFELDLFWIRRAGGDALRYFRQARGRFHLAHVKDMAADGSMVDVGDGVMDWRGLLAAAKPAGLRHTFVEHDESADPLAFARKSHDYLRGIRQ